MYLIYLESAVSHLLQKLHPGKIDSYCELVPCDSAEDIQSIQDVAQRLYNWLIPSLLAEELETNHIQNLVFALDRSIRYIPMAALFDGERYLIEKYTLSTINSAGLTNRR